MELHLIPLGRVGVVSGTNHRTLVPNISNSNTWCPFWSLILQQKGEFPINTLNFKWNFGKASVYNFWIYSNIHSPSKDHLLSNSKTRNCPSGVRLVPGSILLAKWRLQSLHHELVWQQQAHRADIFQVIGYNYVQARMQAIHLGTIWRPQGFWTEYAAKNIVHFL